MLLPVECALATFFCAWWDFGSPPLFALIPRFPKRFLPFRFQAEKHCETQIPNQISASISGFRAFVAGASPGEIFKNKVKSKNLKNQKSKNPKYLRIGKFNPQPAKNFFGFYIATIFFSFSQFPLRKRHHPSERNKGSGPTLVASLGKGRVNFVELSPYAKGPDIDS